ncbi:MAG: THUMP domain-containing protein [Candidatus Korarchaeota archaeon]
MDKYKYIVTTLTGLEDIVSEELEELGARTIEKFRGRIIIEAPLEFIAIGNYLSKTAHKFYVVINEGYADNYASLYKVIFESPFEEVIRSTDTIAVRSEKTEGVKLKRTRMNEIGGSAVLRKYLTAIGERLKVNLSQPDVEIHIYTIHDGRVFVALNTTGESLHKRRYREGYHPAPMRATLAASMIRIGEWNPAK